MDAARKVDDALRPEVRCQGHPPKEHKDDGDSKTRVLFCPVAPIEGMNAKVGKQVPLASITPFTPRMLKEDGQGRYKPTLETFVAKARSQKPSVETTDDIARRNLELEKENRVLLRVIAKQQVEIDALRKGK